MAIEIEQLIPMLARGYVAMDKSGSWIWFLVKPIIEDNMWVSPNCDNYVVLSDCFRIKPVEDWTKSLKRCSKWRLKNW